ncbi:methyl-accepting chemotaxis protein [Liquorilactobacillus satsumensis]
MSLQFKAISTHIETAAHQANKTKRLSQAGNTVVKNTIAQMDRIKQNSTELQQLAAGLNEKAKAIDQVMTLINGISKQTNLLALNASIEAARSENTQGQGFTVVSDEIRKLSEQTGQATLEVAEVVTKIQKDAALSVAKTIAGATSVATGITLINQTSASFTQISDKSNETSQHLARLAREILQLHAKMDSIVGEIAHITSFAAGIAANTSKISEAGRQQKETMQEFVTVSAELSQIAAQLLALVNEFKYKKIN